MMFSQNRYLQLKQGTDLTSPYYLGMPDPKKFYCLSST
jgi:hypothetical protein